MYFYKFSTSENYAHKGVLRLNRNALITIYSKIIMYIRRKLNFADYYFASACTLIHRAVW